MAVEKYVITKEDREFFDSHYAAIAERLAQKRLFRYPQTIGVLGCVYKFTVVGYAKKGTPVWKELQDRATDVE